MHQDNRGCTCRFRARREPLNIDSRTSDAHELIRLDHPAFEQELCVVWVLHQDPRLGTPSHQSPKGQLIGSPQRSPPDSAAHVQIAEPGDRAEHRWPACQARRDVSVHDRFRRHQVHEARTTIPHDGCQCAQGLHFTPHVQAAPVEWKHQMLEPCLSNVGAALARAGRDRDTKPATRGLLCQLEPVRQEVPILGYDHEKRGWVRWHSATNHQRPTSPSSGLLAVAYDLRGMRPAKYASRPARTASFIAVAMATGS